MLKFLMHQPLHVGDNRPYRSHAVQDPQERVAVGCSHEGISARLCRYSKSSLLSETIGTMGAQLGLPGTVRSFDFVMSCFKSMAA